MKTVDVEIGKLNPAPYNPRVMTGEEMKMLEKSLKTWNFLQPIVVNKNGNTVVGGHQRLEAAKNLGYKKVPVVYVEYSKSQEMALNLAMNKISGNWDSQKLKDVIETFDRGEFDIELTGFETHEIENLMTQFYVPDTDVEDVEGLPESTVKMVQLYLDVSNFSEFMTKIDGLSLVYDTDNLTDTGKRAVNEAYQSHE